MESTGIYWKSPYAALEKVGIQALISASPPEALLRLVSRRLEASQEFQSLVIRCGHKCFIIAIVHKMVRIIYAILSTGTYYRDADTDHEALSVQRVASRWIKKLIKSSASVKRHQHLNMAPSGSQAPPCPPYRFLAQ